MLGGSPGLRSQGGKGLLGSGNHRHHGLQALPPALVFGGVAAAVALFQYLFVEQQQIVGEHQALRLRRSDFQTGNLRLGCAKFVFEVVGDLLNVPAPPVEFHEYARR